MKLLLYLLADLLLLLSGEYVTDWIRIPGMIFLGILIMGEYFRLRRKMLT